MYSQSPGAGDSFTLSANINYAPLVCQVLEMIKTASASKSSQCHSAAKGVKLPLVIIFEIGYLGAISFLLEGKGIAMFTLCILRGCSSIRFQISHIFIR